MVLVAILPVVTRGVVWAIRFDFWAIGQDYAVLVRIVVTTVREEFSHVIDIRVAATKGMGAIGVVDAHQEGLLATI